MNDSIPVFAQVEWIVARIRPGLSPPSDDEIIEHFSEKFVGGIGTERIRGTFASLIRLAPLVLEDVGEISRTELTAVLTSHQARIPVHIRVEAEPPNRIDGLVFRGSVTDLLDGGQPCESIAETLDRYMPKYVEGLPAGGVVVGVLAGDESEVTAFGDAATGGLYEIGSITKVFSGVLLAEMVERGEVDYEDPVHKFLGDTRMPRQDAREITLLDLATHSSGLPRLPPNMRRADPRNPYADFTEADLLEAVENTPLEYPIGARVLYSNFAYGLLGHVLGLAADRSYEDLVRERVCVPLELAETFVSLPPALDGRRVQGYGASGDVASHWELPTLAGAGALQSSMDDQLRFLRANLDPATTPIGAALEDAQEPRLPRGERHHIALGWDIYELADGSIVCHKNGGTGGFRCATAFHCGTRSGIVALSNCVASHPGLTALRILADVVATRTA